MSLSEPFHVVIDKLEAFVALEPPPTRPYEEADKDKKKAGAKLKTPAPETPKLTGDGLCFPDIVLVLSPFVILGADDPTESGDYAGIVRNAISAGIYSHVEIGEIVAHIRSGRLRSGTAANADVDDSAAAALPPVLTARLKGIYAYSTDHTWKVSQSIVLAVPFPPPPFSRHARFRA